LVVGSIDAADHCGSNGVGYTVAVAVLIEIETVENMAVADLVVAVAYVTKKTAVARGVSVAGWQRCQSTQQISAVRMVSVGRCGWQY
jgi:hypothetical protein